MRDNDIFSTFENADDDFIKKLSRSTRLTDAEKERMFDMSMRNVKNTQTSVDDRKTGIKQSRPKRWGTIIAAAACIALITCLGALNSAMNKTQDMSDHTNNIFSSDKKAKDEAAPDMNAVNEAEDSVQFNNESDMRSEQYKAGETVRKDISGTYSSENGIVVLNIDGSGTLTFQDTVPMVWNDKEIKTASNSYPYTVNGDTLTINMDGTELTFSKEAELPQ